MSVLPVNILCRSEGDAKEGHQNITSRSNSYRAEVLNSSDALQSRDLLEKWKALAGPADSPTTLFRSPEWVAHCLARSGENGQRLAAVFNSQTELIGVVPLAKGSYALQLSVKFRSVLKFTLSAIHILGGEPWGDPDCQRYDVFFRVISEAFNSCDCIHFPMIATDSFCWQYLRESRLVREAYLLYVPHTPCKYRVVVLPQSFDSYLRQFNSKERNNLARRVRRLKERANGRVDLVRFAGTAEVSRFLELASRVERGSWQHAHVTERIEQNTRWQQMLTDLAERGLLRSYILACDGIPCAFVFGYQLGDVFHYVQVGYDQAFRDHSPGMVMLYLLIEDLINHRPAKLMSFGFGDHPYKELIGNSYTERIDVLLLRRSVRNRLRIASHAAAAAAIKIAKKCLRGRKAF